MAEASVLNTLQCGFESRRGYDQYVGSVDEPKAPRINEIGSPELAAGAVDELESRGYYDRVDLSGLDLSGLDLTGARFEECLLARCSLEDTRLDAVRLLDCRLDGLNVAVLKAARPDWHGVELTGSRVGSAELYDGEWRSVTVTGAKLGYLNFRHSTLEDVRFSGCTIEELDLGGATLNRVAFDDCTVETLTLQGARCTDLDLRGADLRGVNGVSGLAGATVGADQLLELAPLLAAELGVSVSEAY
jgi:uncharacterized protein YjbI with pentapeptide repeats